MCPAAFSSPHPPFSWQQPWEQHWFCVLLTWSHAALGQKRGQIWKRWHFSWHSNKVSLHAHRTTLPLFHLLNHRPWRQSICQFTAHQTFPRAKQFFSDIKLSCTEYLIYHFLNIISITFLYEESLPTSTAVILKTFLYTTALASAAALGQHVRTACSHEHSLGNLCECLAVLQRQAQLVRGKTNTCPAPNHSQCPKGPSREEWSADASVQGRGWPSCVYCWNGAISPAVITLLLSFTKWASHRLGFHPAFGFFQWQIMIS